MTKKHRVAGLAKRNEKLIGLRARRRAAPRGHGDDPEHPLPRALNGVGLGQPAAALYQEW